MTITSYRNPHTTPAPPSQTITWDGSLTAVSSLAHVGQTRGTISLLRREVVAQPDGSLVHVPVISGNSLRGRLRRVGEELLRDTLTYEGQLTPAVAHALRSGGSLAKTTGEPLSGNRLRDLRNLVPHVAVFGAAGGGRIIDGALDVGKVVPLIKETSHITGRSSTLSAFDATQLESYTHQDDVDAHDFAEVLDITRVPLDEDGRPALSGENDPTRQMLYRIETFPSGTAFTTWLRLRRAQPLEIAFLLDVLSHYQADGRLGGRIGTGHGQIRLDLQADTMPQELPDWRLHATTHRDEILTILETLR